MTGFHTLDAAGSALGILYAEDFGIEAPGEVPGLGQVPELRRAIVEALQASNQLATVPYERVRRIALVAETPSLETGELTPTMKLVRAVVTGRHQELAQALREETPHPQILDLSRRGDAFLQA